MVVTPEGGQPVRFGAGDQVVFAAGLNCVWEVHEPVRKHTASVEMPPVLI